LQLHALPIEHKTNSALQAVAISISVHLA
jgi:hypothetical protein